jgi:hypothetical protein
MQTLLHCHAEEDNKARRSHPFDQDAAQLFVASKDMGYFVP